jgi:hypothetical protein
LGFQLLKGTLDLEKFFIELILFSLVLSGFYLFPLLIGFTLYFSVLHSLKVLEEEFEFIKSMYTERLSLFTFGKMLLRYTLVSLIGMVILFIATYFKLIEGVSFGFLLLILISSITLPHAFVMERFYHFGKKPIAVPSK